MPIYTGDKLLRKARYGSIVIVMSRDDDRYGRVGAVISVNNYTNNITLRFTDGSQKTYEPDELLCPWNADWREFVSQLSESEGDAIEDLSSDARKIAMVQG